MDEPRRRWHNRTVTVKAWPFTAGLLILGVIWCGMLYIAGEGYLQGRENHRDLSRALAKVSALADSTHRLTVGLCEDVNGRVKGRKQSDGAAARAFARDALASQRSAEQWYIALATSPKDAPNRILAWRLWASLRSTYHSDAEAARALSDHGLLQTETRC